MDSTMRSFRVCCCVQPPSQCSTETGQWDAGPAAIYEGLKDGEGVRAVHCILCRDYRDLTGTRPFVQLPGRVVYGVPGKVCILSTQLLAFVTVHSSIQKRVFFFGFGDKWTKRKCHSGNWTNMNDFSWQKGKLKQLMKQRLLFRYCSGTEKQI